MEKISFREIFYESLELLKADKKRFGMLLSVMVTIGLLFDIFKDNFLSGFIFLIGVIVVHFIRVWTVVVSKNYIENKRIEEKEFVISEIKKKWWNSVLLILFKTAIILLVSIALSIPLSIVITPIGTSVGTTLVKIILGLLFIIPLLFLIVFLNYSFQYLVIKKNTTVDCIKNSCLLVKSNFNRIIIVGIKIVLISLMVPSILVKIPFLGVLLYTLLDIMGIIMNTFVFYRLMEENTYEI